MGRSLGGKRVEIRKRMLEKDMSMTDLAEACDVTLRHMSCVVNGRVTASTKLVARIEEVLGIELHVEGN